VVEFKTQYHLKKKKKPMEVVQGGLEEKEKEGGLGAISD
jgi:hypothetical protein